MAKLKYTVIKNRKQYNEYCSIVDGFLELEDATQAHDDELELLTVLIEKWDAEHSRLMEQDPVQILHLLMNQHRLNATDMTQIMEVSKSHVSEILNYKKGLSKDVIRRLAEHFKMNQDALNRPYELHGNDAEHFLPAKVPSARKSHRTGKAAMVNRSVKNIVQKKRDRRKARHA